MEKAGQRKISSLLISVEAFIKETGLFEPGARILIGVSGGPDSMALLSVLTELRTKWDLGLMVLHCHHGLRAAADEEEVFVRTWSKNLGCPFFSRKLPVRNFQKGSGKSLQEAARELRYRAFLEVAKLKKADRVALAHTANDQAEEVLIGLIRGAGLGGLAGISARRGPIIRPLIKTFRKELLDYLSAQKIPFKEDASNRDFRYLRARVRHHLLPELKKYSPNILVQLNQTAGLLQKDDEYLQEKVDQLAGRLFSRQGQTISILRSGLIGHPGALGSRLIQKAILQSLGHLRHIRAVHILGILEAAQGKRKQGRILLPEGWSALWDQDYIRIRPSPIDPKPIKPFVYEIEKPRELFIEETGERVYLKKIKASFESSWFLNNKNPVRVDFDKLAWPLLIRNKRSGDRFRPLGMKGSKKVSRYFMDRKVAKADRERIPIILAGGEIVWIAGMDIGQAFSLDSRSTRALEMEYLK